MYTDNVRDEGFEIFKNGLVRRLSPTHYVAKALRADAWQIVELKNGKWVCDCLTEMDSCVHLYAAQLHRSTSKLQPEQPDLPNLKCRYCGSPDLRGCGFRYNARGIVKRYFCNDCQRKFSIPYVRTEPQAKPAELMWLLNELGMVASKLLELLSDLSLKLGAEQATQDTPSAGTMR